MTRPFSIVVAADSELGIAKNGDLPWHIPGDLKWFKMVTSTPPVPGQLNTVFMGRKTWESIPDRFRPLPNRRNIIITRQTSYGVTEDAIVVGSITEALEQAADGAIFCVGGGEIYRMAMAMQECKTVYFTKIQGTFGCDTFLNDPTDNFELVENRGVVTENETSYEILTLRRK